MQELSPLREESAKQIAATVRPCTSGKALPGTLASTHRRQKLSLMLGFDAWHFQLSEGPILEEMIYA
jgi:hypothetical protein